MSLEPGDADIGQRQGRIEEIGITNTPALLGKAIVELRNTARTIDLLSPGAHSEMELLEVSLAIHSAIVRLYEWNNR